ncbi:hypothetical protein MAPG_01659 [Magnaporthiopsis poae ATCC 64411]|uniref:Uncharacterized protein n=1 Tax=Magnaporthiopsis poae (strain ATCC 64411 / 73-15) TaxID=644358 RepID=A0A0C4DPA0_MAGP6|nr:hypothetical protein MAPG_01659 [Magnaporthiopsis poae ATCC 64411]
MTPHLPPALRRAQSTYMLSTEPLRPTHSRSRSVVRLLGGWPEKKTGHSAQEFVDDLKLQRYRMSEFPNSLRGSPTSSSSSSSNRSSRHRSLSPGRNYDSGDDASDEASSASDGMSIAEPDVSPAAERAQGESMFRI